MFAEVISANASKCPVLIQQDVAFGLDTQVCVAGWPDGTAASSNNI